MRLQCPDTVCYSARSMQDTVPKHAGGGSPITRAGATGLAWEAAPESIPRPKKERKARTKTINPGLMSWVKGESQVHGAFQRYLQGDNMIPGTTEPLVKLGPSTVEYFDLKDPADRKKVNALLARSHRDVDTDNPAIAITERSNQVVGDSLVVYCMWADVYYRRIRS